MKNKIEKRILDINDVKLIDPDFEKIKILSFDLAKKSEALIFDSDWSKLFILTTNNYQSILSQILDRIATKWYKFEFYYTDELSFDFAMWWYDQLATKEKLASDSVKERKTVIWKDAVNMIKKVFEEQENFTEQEFITEIIRLSFQAWSSDLHFQPEEAWVVLRLRIDWVLKTVLVFDSNKFKKYLIKLKFMSWVRVNIDKIPQDWRFDFIAFNKNQEEKKIDVRVSFMPALRWESIVMRYLDSTKSIIWFWDIWFQWQSLKILNSNLQKNQWMILVTWPTWSGKTTTLYSMLNYLNWPWKKIITLEDPVEYELPWIQQSQISSKDWYDYSDWLKAILRQDPEIIMVWEIRTLETAEIAINAALTWHLVISTLHTNSAVEAISRLLSMWVKPYMLAPALNLVIWQRLLRKLHNCKKSRPANIAELEDVKQQIKSIKDVSRNFNLEFDWNIPLPTWCEDCWADWYVWRIAAVETFQVDDDIRSSIVWNKSEVHILSQARQWWYLTMKDDAYIKMLNWETTLDEIRRVI